MEPSMERGIHPYWPAFLHAGGHSHCRLLRDNGVPSRCPPLSELPPRAEAPLVADMTCSSSAQLAVGSAFAAHWTTCRSLCPLSISHLQDEEKNDFAKESVAWALRNRQLAQMFPQLQELSGNSSTRSDSATGPSHVDASLSGPSQGRLFRAPL